MVYIHENYETMKNLLIALLPILFTAQKTAENKTALSSLTVNEDGKINLSDTEWKDRLTDMEYYVLREQGTERAFTGDLLNNKKEGVYICAACKLPLFSSETKYKSGTGWPSFWQPVNEENVDREVDKSLGMVRSEVHCARCGGHLGHVFPDGPKPTGLRYCINSVSLDFTPQVEQ